MKVDPCTIQWQKVVKITNKSLKSNEVVNFYLVLPGSLVVSHVVLQRFGLAIIILWEQKQD